MSSLTPLADNVSVTATTQVVTLNDQYKMIILTNLDGGDNVSINMNGNTAVDGEGIVLKPGKQVVLNAKGYGGVFKKFACVCPGFVDATIETTTPGVDAVSEVQTITIDATGGTFDVTWSGQTAADLAYDISAANLQTALEALSNIEVGDVTVTKDGFVYTLTWLASKGNVAEPTTSATNLTGGASTATVATVTPGVDAVAEVQTIQYTAASGTFTITYDGQTTAAIDFDATAAEVEDALDALSNIENGDVEVTGTAGDYTLTWLASKGNVAQPTVTSSLYTYDGAAVLAYMAL